MSKRIGFLTYWGFGRGQAYLSLAYAKMLLPDNEVFIFKQGENDIAPEFNIDVNVTEYPTYHIDPSVFKLWIETHKLDAVIFLEYNQWKDDGNNLVQVAKDCGAKTYGWLVWEKWTKAEDYKDYDRLIASTTTFEKFYRRNKIRKFSYLPYSIDLSEFPHPDNVDTNKKPFTFFHPGGFGGVHKRKNTELVLEAFLELGRDDVNLVITSQLPMEDEFLKKIKDFDNIKIYDEYMDRKDIINMYYHCDAVILPSKWESIGLPILESLAAGKPVITPNAPPMNEFIRTAMNGFLVTGDMKKYSDIGIYAIETSAKAIKNAMINMLSGPYELLSKNARYVVEELYDLEKNKKYMKDFIKKELK